MVHHLLSNVLLFCVAIACAWDPPLRVGNQKLIYVWLPQLQQTLIGIILRTHKRPKSLIGIVWPPHKPTGLLPD